MDERHKLLHLFEFDLWCTRKLINYFLQQSPFSEETACLAFLSHIVNAQEVWFHRVLKQAGSPPEIWAEYPPEELTEKAKEANRKWADLISNHEPDLNSSVHYQNSKGVSYSNSLWQICHHLIIHGQHHRAQINLLLRKSGKVPPPIDYIVFARLRA